MSELFELVQLPTLTTVRQWVGECEGRHKQQVMYSTYHDALTQVCFDCKKIRTNMLLGESDE